jgi:hypothetical protein
MIINTGGYELFETVFIIPLELNGVIISFWYGCRGLQYEVRYYFNGDAKTVYMFLKPAF